MRSGQIQIERRVKGMDFRLQCKVESLTDLRLIEPGRNGPSAVPFRFHRCADTKDTRDGYWTVDISPRQLRHASKDGDHLLGARQPRTPGYQGPPHGRPRGC